jgi:hypothetical protein
MSIQKRTIVIIVLFFHLVSCKSDIITYSFRGYEDLKTTPYIVDIPDDNWVPFQLCIIDSLLLLQDEDESSFHLFNLHNRKHITAFGEKEGPGSLVDPECFCQSFIAADSTYLIITENPKNRLDIVNLSHLISANELLMKEVPVPDIYLPKSMYFVDENKIVGVAGGAGVFFNYDVVENKVTYSPEKPQIEKHYPLYIQDFIYTGVSTFDIESGLVFIAFVLFNRIDVYSAENGFVRSIYFDKKKTIEPVIKDGFPAPTNIQYFRNIKARNGLLYLQYHGKEVSELSNSEETIIHVIDYNGKAIRAIRFEGHVLDFDVGNGGSALYATIDTDSLQNIIKVDLRK